MKGFVIGSATTALAFYVLISVLPEVAPLPRFVTYEGELVGLLGLAVIFGVVNGLIGPIIKLVALPISFMTMGLVGFLINGGLLLATALIADKAGFNLTVADFPPDLTADSIVAAVVGSVILSLVGTVVRLVVKS